MSKERKNQLSEIMNLAWANIKLRTQLTFRVVEFYFKKVDGTLPRPFNGGEIVEVIPQSNNNNYGITKIC